MKIAIVGCGGIAQVHVPYILEIKEHQIVGVCDQDERQAKALAQRFKIGKVYTNFSQLLQEQKPDVVHVATPPQAHAELTLQATEAGCHVLVEKPMALSVEEADAMIAAAQKQHVKLCVNHIQLFDPVILRAQRLIAEGSIGKVISLESYYGFNLAQVPERRWIENLQGGLFQDVAPHPLSLILQFLEDPVELHASTLATGTLGSEIPDELRVLMTGNNAVGTLSISFGIKPYLNFLKVYGSKAVLNADLNNMILSMERLRPQLPKAVARGLMSIEQGMELTTGAVSNAFRYALGRIRPYQGMGALIRRFYESIEHDHAPPVSGEAGRRVLEVFERIRTQLPTSPARQRAVWRSGNGDPKVFVTGASGFLGSHLVEGLTNRKAVVRALVRPTSRISHLRDLDIDWVEGDLRNTEKLAKAMEGCDIAFHCAAATGGSWNDYVEGTIRGTERMLAAATAAGVRRLVYVSTLSVYATTQLKENELVGEDAPIEPHPERRNYYARTKIEAENLVRAYAQNNGLPTSILRPGMIYGPRGQLFFPSIGFALKDKLFMVIGSGNQLLPLVYVGNVVNAMWLAATRKEGIGGIYNIVDDDEITGRQYLEQFIERKELKAATVHVPFWMVYLAAGLLEAQAGLTKKISPPVLSRHRLICATKNLRYDTSRAKEQLHWKPTVSLEEGLARTFESTFRSA